MGGENGDEAKGRYEGELVRVGLGDKYVCAPTCVDEHEGARNPSTAAPHGSHAITWPDPSGDATRNRPKRPSQGRFVLFSLPSLSSLLALALSRLISHLNDYADHGLLLLHEQGPRCLRRVGQRSQQTQVQVVPQVRHRGRARNARCIPRTGTEGRGREHGLVTTTSLWTLTTT